jgi:hypothetical protein
LESGIDDECVFGGWGGGRGLKAQRQVRKAIEKKEEKKEESGGHHVRRVKGGEGYDADFATTLMPSPT